MPTPIRLGLVGLNFGMTVCRELTSEPDLPVHLAKVCDLDGQKAQAAAQELGVPWTTNLEELLDDPQLDAIGLFTGPHGRAALIRKIIHAGKHVMTTKPFELDPEAARSVLQEAQALNRVVHMNSPNPRPYGEMVIIREWIEAGVLGRLTVAQANSWCYYGKTLADGTWYDDSHLCPVAPILRLGIYTINILLSIFPTPLAVQVTHSRIETERPTPDNAALTILFEGGAIANIMSSFVVGSEPDRYRGNLVIAGTRGRIYLHPGAHPRSSVPVANLFLSTDTQLEQRTVTRFSGSYDWDFFAQRIRGEVAQDVIQPETIVTAVRIIRAMSEAEQTGQTVPVR